METSEDNILPVTSNYTSKISPTKTRFYHKGSHTVT